MPTLNEHLGMLPSGLHVALSDDDVTRRLRDDYRTDADTQRRKAVRVRLDFFEDRSQKYIEADIDRVFKNARVRTWRKDLVPFALFQNITRRIVVEKSAVYAEPAARTVRAGNERYQNFQRAVQIDRRMRAVNEFVNLLNDVLLWPSLRGDGLPVLHVVTPDRFVPIAHPNDPTWLVGVIIDRFPRGVASPTSPHYLVADEETWFALDKDWRMVSGSRQPHNLGRLPVVLASRTSHEDGLLDSDSGIDLISAHRAIALLNVLMLKTQKSGTRQPYVSGDMSTAAMDQPMDEEFLMQFPEGTAPSTLDLGADPSSYILAARAVIKQVAANHGIPESVFDLSYQATSGFEIELKRVGLREVRRAQLIAFRPIERQVAELQSALMTSSMMAFDMAGWSINFGELETPQDPLAKLQYWEQLARMGLANVVEMYLDMNPEATEVEAIAAVERNLASNGGASGITQHLRNEKLAEGDA